MFIDLSILYRVIYEPRRTFERFVEGARIEAFILVLVFAVTSTIRGYPLLHQKEFTSSLALFVGSLTILLYSALVSLVFPLLDAVFVFFVARRVFRLNRSFGAILTALIMCALPVYFGAMLVSFNENFYIGLGNVFRSFSGTHPILYGVMVNITPFYVWMVFLWWVALGVLLHQTWRYRIILVTSLAVVDLVINQLVTGSLSELVGHL